MRVTGIKIQNTETRVVRNVEVEFHLDALDPHKVPLLVERSLGAVARNMTKEAEGTDPRFRSLSQHTSRSGVVTVNVEVTWVPGWRWNRVSSAMPTLEAMRGMSMRDEK